MSPFPLQFILKQGLSDDDAQCVESFAKLENLGEVLMLLMSGKHQQGDVADVIRIARHKKNVL